MRDDFITEMSAQEIANIIQDYFTRQDGKSFFKLALTRGTERRTLWVRPNLRKQPFTLESDDQIVQCESSGGLRVDIHVPSKTREYQPATVVVAKHPGAH